jgi:hypothetical protein
MPGTDHAGIATQMVVERQLAQAKQPGRRELGREAFLQRVWAWKEESGGTISRQLRRLGSSLDWPRERFTMDAGLSQAVVEVFVRLHKAGLIYQDKRLVNWDPRLQTAVSDLEVESIEMKGNLWHIKYAVEGSDEVIIITSSLMKDMNSPVDLYRANAIRVLASIADAGLLATFMPKPFADKTGNGAHFNMSLGDATSGKNLFQGTPGDDPCGIGISQLGLHFIGGILKHGRALCAAFAPTVNSYKRLIKKGAMGYYSWAPVFNSFGTNNRTNSVRVPMGGGRCESRNADSACNPYLAGALVLAAGLEGIREKIDPGAPQSENLYEFSDAQLAARGIQSLPRTLAEAVDAFEADPFVEATLGKELRDEFITLKRAEWEEYHLTISQWETEKYASLY